MNKRDDTVFKANKDKFFNQNFVSLFSAMLLPLFLLSLSTSFLINGFIIRQVDDKNQTRVENYGQYLDSKLNEVELLDYNLSANSTIKIALKSIFQETKNSITLESLDIVNSISELLKSSIQTSPFIDSVLFYLENPNGWFLSSESPLENIKHTEDSFWYSWYQNNMEFDKEVLCKGISNDNKYSIMKPVVSSLNQQKEGVVVVNINREDLQSLMTKLTDGHKGDRIIIRDASGATLFSSKNWKNDSSFRMYETPSNFYGWTYLLSCPSSEIVLLRRTFLLLYLFIFLLSASSASFFSSRIAKRDAMELENLRYSLDEKKPLRVVTSSFRTDLYAQVVKEMVDSFLQVENLQKEVREKEFETKLLSLQTLSSQLTPHFLYNTLQVISWKTIALTGKPNEASFMIDQLSILLRYVLDNVQLFSSLEDEINVTKAYVSIQQIRFNHAFDIQWDIGDVALSLLVPKLILQPLVENAISHGLRMKKGEKKLFLHIYPFRGRDVKFQIIDNGVGMSSLQQKQVLHAMNRTGIDASIKIPHDVKNDRSHIGLFNTNKRLRLLYNSLYSLSVRSHLGKGTCVSFRIPDDYADFKNKP